MDIAIMFPRDYGRPRLVRALCALGSLAIPGAKYTVTRGDTDAPCVDVHPYDPKTEADVARVLGGVK